MARYHFIATGAVSVSDDPKFNGNSKVQTGIYGFDLVTEHVAKNMKTLTAFSQYGGFSGKHREISFDNGGDLCNKVDGSMSLNGKDSKIGRLIIIDHGYMLEEPQMVSHPRYGKPVEMKGVLAFGPIGWA